MEFCEICHDDFPRAGISKVSCGSTPEHWVCHYCEGEWRSTMPLEENGMRIMTCPKCRGLEKERTTDSLQREVVRLNRIASTSADEAFIDQILDGLGILDFDGIDFDFSNTSVPNRVCASGRDCQNRSTDVTLCPICNVVPCCRDCCSCVGCVPTFRVLVQ